MTRLLHLNGPPGIGKSTLARRYVAVRPGVLCCDIDVLRGLVGGWEGRFAETGALIRPAALAMIGAYLAGGNDVVLPQMLLDPGELARFEACAAHAGADYVEVVLVDDVDATLARFHARGDDGDADGWHAHVRTLVAGQGGDDALRGMHARVVANAAARESTVVATRAGDVDGALAAVTAAFDG